MPVVLRLMAALAGLASLGPVLAETRVPSACLPAASITGLTVVAPHALDVAAEGGFYRLDLDPSCAGVRPGETIQIASTAGPICADGRSAAVTAAAICPVQAIRPTSSPAERCFRIRDVRGFAVMRGEKVAITLRGGGKRLVQVDAACPQLDRLEEFDLVSGARDGRICGHPQDAIIGRPGEAVLDGIAKQFTANDFRPCRILSVEPMAATGDDHDEDDARR